MNNTTKQTAIVAAALAAATFNVSADQAMAPTGADKCYTGKVVSVDPQDKMLGVQSWAFSKKEFNLGANCTYALLPNNGTATDLRPGEKVTVYYQDSQGVRIADRVEQVAMRFEGMVVAIDNNAHTLTLRQHGMDKPMLIADGCIVSLRNDKPGVLTDVKAGDHVTVTYETPKDTPIARQISQTSIAFTGKLTAIDLDQKTVRARGTYDTLKFNLADNCAIVINGRTDGKLSELKPNDRLQFDYDTVNGVNIVNRIAPAPAEEQKNSMYTTTPAYPGYPGGF